MVLKHTQLSYFVKVAEVGQITRAATLLHIAQPALSQSITQLESQLGVKLFERHPRGVALTSAGAVFLEKAKIALEAQADAASTAASLARDLRGVLQIGFLSIPPMLMAPDLLEAFAAVSPEVEIASRELRFPTSSPSSWLADVDVALCHAPVPDPAIGTLMLREDPRVVVMRADHRLARREQLSVEEILDETFYGCHPTVERAWSAFWHLDHERGGPAKVTGDRPGNMLEQVATMASSQAISTFPASVASVIVDLVPELVAVALIGAAPAGCTLVWHRSRSGSVVEDFVAVARELTGGAPPEEQRGRRRGSTARTVAGRSAGPRSATGAHREGSVAGSGR